MNKLLITLLAAIIMSPSAIHAQAADTNKPAVKTKPALTEVQIELRKIQSDIAARYQELKGKVTEADLADQLKALDALLAKHTEKTEEMAAVFHAKINLFANRIKDTAKADKLTAQLFADYKDTQLVKRILADEKRKAEDAKKQAALKPGMPFPDFKATDINGKDISVADYKGKVVLIDFWATWCGPCVGELPNVIANYKKYNKDGFEVIGISLDKKREALDAYLKKTPDMTWRQICDEKWWDSDLVKQYGVSGIPFTILVDADGKIIGTKLRGPALGEALEKALKK